MERQIISKYQKKNFEEITYELSEYTCLKCDRPFMADERYFPVTDDGQELNYDFIRITCPYCGHRFLRHT